LTKIFTPFCRSRRADFKYIYFVGSHEVFFYYNYIIGGKNSKIDRNIYIEMENGKETQQNQLYLSIIINVSFRHYNRHRQLRRLHDREAPARRLERGVAPHGPVQGGWRRHVQGQHQRQHWRAQEGARRLRGQELDARLRLDAEQGGAEEWRQRCVRVRVRRLAGRQDFGDGALRVGRDGAVAAEGCEASVKCGRPGAGG
jgi:hypothetical protein